MRFRQRYGEQTDDTPKSDLLRSLDNSKRGWDEQLELYVGYELPTYQEGDAEYVLKELSSIIGQADEMEQLLRGQIDALMPDEDVDQELEWSVQDYRRLKGRLNEAWRVANTGLISLRETSIRTLFEHAQAQISSGDDTSEMAEDLREGATVEDVYRWQAVLDGESLTGDDSYAGRLQSLGTVEHQISAAMKL